MQKNRTENIRNLAFMGQAGTGKTTLTEKLLFHAGAINSPGSVEKGTTVSDFEPEEQRYHHSLHTAVVGLDYHGTHINLLDTPGYPDFIGQTLSAAPAADTLAVVINAQNGVEPMSRRLMEWAENHGYCRMIIVNKIDGEETKLAALLEDIRNNFSNACIPINAPTKDGTAVIDCLQNASGDTVFASCADLHTTLIDQIVEMDDSLMEQYLEKGDIEPELLHDAFEKALRQGHLIPVCFASARTDVGVKELLQMFSRLMPNPTEGTAHKFLNGDASSQGKSWFSPTPSPDEHALAHVFKVTFDPFIGKLGVFRIHQGKINKDTLLYVDDTKKPFKVGRLFKIQGKNHVETHCGLPGDICAIAKIDELHFNAILHETNAEDSLRLPDLDIPQPMSGLALDVQAQGDEQKMAEALEKITIEDPCLNIERNSNTHETIIKGMGELHLRVALEKLTDVYHIKANTHAPNIDYRESITTSAQGHYRHKKQSGGAGQFGEVYIRLEPLKRGKGFEFVNAIVGGTIPAQFIPAVEKGLHQAMQHGSLAGYPVQDVKVTVYDGKHHSVDSNEISFVTAARKAFLDAFTDANPVLLEPIVKLEITTLQDFMGDISGDLASRRGRISYTQSLDDGRIKITAQVPLAELNQYGSRLKSLTGGEGEFFMSPLEYEPVPAEMQHRLVKTNHV